MGKQKKKNRRHNQKKDNDVLIEEKYNDVFIEENTESDHLDQDKDLIHQSIIRSCLDYFDEMGFTETSRMLEKESGNLNWRYFEELVERREWNLLENYLSQFFDICKSQMLAKIKRQSFVDGSQREGTPLLDPQLLECDYGKKESMISELEELIRANLKERDQLKQPKKSILWSHFTGSRSNREDLDLVGVHRRPQGETKDEYRKFDKMTIFHKTLGEGKVTKVREGEYENMPAAIKCIPIEGNVEKHEKEVLHLIQSEGHQNVVRYYGRERETSFYFIALEKCLFSLHDLMDKEKNVVEINSIWDPLYHPHTVLLSLIRDIVMGLHHLHTLHKHTPEKQSLIHRDLKPTNILIKEEGGKLRAKVSDMGMSKLLQRGASSTTNTPSRKLIDLDEVTWKAPEQTKENARVGPYVDLYNLGCIIHFCLTEGKHPVEAQNSGIDPTTCDTQQLLQLLKPKMPEAYDIVGQLMSSKKEERPSAEQVLKHPFFWDSTRRNDFLRHASDWLDEERRTHYENNTVSLILTVLESRKKRMFGDRWDDKIDLDFVKCLRKTDPLVKFDHVFDLVRVIRNKSNHFSDLPENVKILIPGKSPNGLEEYFIRIFPNLLLEVYKVALKYGKNDDTLRQYFT